MCTGSLQISRLGQRESSQADMSRDVPRDFILSLLFFLLFLQQVAGRNEYSLPGVSVL